MIDIKKILWGRNKDIIICLVAPIINLITAFIIGYFFNALTLILFITFATYLGSSSYILHKFNISWKKSILIGSIISLVTMPFSVGYVNDFTARLNGFYDAADRNQAYLAGIPNQEQYNIYAAKKLKDEERQREADKIKASREAEQKRVKDAKEAEQERIDRERRYALFLKNAEAKRLEEEKKEADCKKTLECIGHKFIGVAEIRCQKEIERLAKYSFKWTDQGFLVFKFSSYAWANNQHTIVSVFGDKIEFQNGFGAYQNHIYQCDIGIDDEKIYSVNAFPGRL